MGRSNRYRKAAVHRVERKAVPRSKRSWSWSVTIAAALVGGGILLSAVINPMFGRYVHWDWVAGAAPPLLVAVTLTLRNRWV